MQTVPLSVIRPPAPPRPPLQEALCRPCEIRLPAIARRLGIADQTLRTIIAKIRLLAQKHDFPLPKTPRFLRGVRQTGPLSIDARSVWDRDLVEQWFDQDRPPQETIEAVAARKASVRSELTRRLQLVVSR